MWFCAVVGWAVRGSIAAGNKILDAPAQAIPANVLKSQANTHKPLRYTITIKLKYPNIHLVFGATGLAIERGGVDRAPWLAPPHPPKKAQLTRPRKAYRDGPRALEVTQTQKIGTK